MVVDWLPRFAHFLAGMALMLMGAAWLLTRFAERLSKLVEELRLEIPTTAARRILYEVVFFVAVAVAVADYAPIIWRSALGYGCAS